MIPRDQKILKTLEMLVMLSRSRQQFSYGLSEEEKATLTISRQVLQDSGLTIPELADALDHITKKGYLFHVVIFDEHLRSQMNDFLNNEDQYAQVLKALEVMNTKENSAKLKQEVIENFSPFIPAGIEPDPKDLDDEVIKFTDAFEDGIAVFKQLRSDEIGFVLLMPFREIDTLLERMNDGENFDDIQDGGFWYDQVKFEFHIAGEIIPTSYQGKPNLVHPVLKELFSKPSVSKVDYEDIPGFDISKGTTAYRDAMRKFVKKHPKLDPLFTVREYCTEIHTDHIP